MSVLSPENDNYSSSISISQGVALENVSWLIPTKLSGQARIKNCNSGSAVMHTAGFIFFFMEPNCCLLWIDLITLEGNWPPFHGSRILHNLLIVNNHSWHILIVLGMIVVWQGQCPYYTRKSWRPVFLGSSFLLFILEYWLTDLSIFGMTELYDIANDLICGLLIPMDIMNWYWSTCICWGLFKMNVRVSKGHSVVHSMGQ